MLGASTSGSTPVTGAQDFLQVDIESGHGCALNDAGELECWGNSNYGVPAHPTASGYQMVSVGIYSACAIRSDNTLDCWGHDQTSGFFYGSWTYRTYVYTTYYDWTCQCYKTGFTYQYRTAWGNRYQDACYLGDCGVIDNEPAGTYAKVAVGTRHACALSTSGSIECWGIGVNDCAGYNSCYGSSSYTCSSNNGGTPGTCSTGSYTYGQATDAPTDSGYIDLAVKDDRNCALKDTGEIVCWGANGTAVDSAPTTIEVPDFGPDDLLSGDALSCTVTAYDGIDAGNTETSAILTVP